MRGIPANRGKDGDAKCWDGLGSHLVQLPEDGSSSFQN